MTKLVKTRKNLERGKGDQEINEGTSQQISKKGDLDHYRGGDHAAISLKNTHQNPHQQNTRKERTRFQRGKDTVINILKLS